MGTVAAADLAGCGTAVAGRVGTADADCAPATEATTRPILDERVTGFLFPAAAAEADDCMPTLIPPDDAILAVLDERVDAARVATAAAVADRSFLEGCWAADGPPVGTARLGEDGGPLLALVTLLGTAMAPLPLTGAWSPWIETVTVVWVAALTTASAAATAPDEAPLPLWLSMGTNSAEVPSERPPSMAAAFIATRMPGCCLASMSGSGPGPEPDPPRSPSASPPYMSISSSPKKSPPNSSDEFGRSLHSLACALMVLGR